jgi:hypothetical protein
MAMRKQDIKPNRHVWMIQAHKINWLPCIGVVEYIVDVVNVDNYRLCPVQGGIVITAKAEELFSTEKHARGVLVAFLEAMLGAAKLEQKMKGEIEDE